MDLKNQNVKLRVEIADEKSKIKELEEQNCRETIRVKELEDQNQNSKESHQKVEAAKPLSKKVVAVPGKGCAGLS